LVTQIVPQLEEQLKSLIRVFNSRNCFFLVYYFLPFMSGRWQLQVVHNFHKIIKLTSHFIGNMYTFKYAIYIFIFFDVMSCNLRGKSKAIKWQAAKRRWAQKIINKKQNRKLKIEQREPHTKKPNVNSGISLVSACRIYQLSILTFENRFWTLLYLLRRQHKKIN
jgi:hypothetical protein